MEGRFSRTLITSKLRATETYQLALMLVVGSFCTLLGTLPVLELTSGAFVLPEAWCASFLPGVLGLLLLINFALSVINLLNRAGK